MIKLVKALQDWQSDTFTQTLKSEISSLDKETLPLEKGTSQGGIVGDSDISVTVLSVTDDKTTICATVGIFFTEIVGGCSCGDDPLEENAYCEVQVEIDKATAEAVFTVIAV